MADAKYIVPKGTRILVREGLLAPAKAIVTTRDLEFSSMPPPKGREYEVRLHGYIIRVPESSVIVVERQGRLF